MSHPHLLYAVIKKSSKYHGQTPDGDKFPVTLCNDLGGYVVQGGPGGQYRLSDVELFTVCASYNDDMVGDMVKIT